MWGKNKDIIRNVRIDSELNDMIIDIAKAEKRTITNTIQVLLGEAVQIHLRLHPKTLEIINGDTMSSDTNEDMLLDLEMRIPRKSQTGERHTEK